MIVINTEADIKQLKLGDSYIIGGPEDPIEFIAFHDKIKPLIDKHIAGLLNEPIVEIEKPKDFKEELISQLTVEELAECYRVVDAKAVARKYKMRGYSKLRELDLWKFVKENLSKNASS